MDPKGGARVCREIREERGQLSAADLLVTSIPKAGHYPFLDQPDLFMKALLEQTQPYRYALTVCHDISRQQNITSVTRLLFMHAGVS